MARTRRSSTTAIEIAESRSQMEKNLEKLRTYLADPDKLDSNTKSGLESYLKKFEEKAAELDSELTESLKNEMAQKFPFREMNISTLIRFFSTKGLIRPEHWPSVKEVLGDTGFGGIELEKVRLSLVAFEEDPVYLIVLWLENRRGTRNILDRVAKKRLDAIAERVREKATHPLTPVLLASIPLLFENPEMSFLKELLDKPEELSGEEKARFKELYHLAMKGERVELGAIVAKVIDAHSELMTKAKFSIM